MKCFAEDAAFPFRNRRADFVFAGVLLVSALALILGCVLFSRSHSLEALFVYLLCGAFVLVLECLTWCTFIATPRETPFGMTGVLLLSKLLGVSLMCSIVLEGITLFGCHHDSLVDSGLECAPHRVLLRAFVRISFVRHRMFAPKTF